MSRMMNPHEPTPEFRAHLEWEIRRAYRAAKIEGSSFPARLTERMRAAAVILLAVAVGFGGSVLSAQIQDGRQRQQLLAAEQMELELASRRIEIARSIVTEEQRRVDLGIAGRESFLAAEAELQAMEATRARIAINVVEIQATSNPPRDDIAAPLVGRRDFVRERLDLDLMAAQRRLTVAEGDHALAQRRHRLGTATELPVLEAQAELARARADLELLAKKRELRQQVIQRTLDPAEATRNLRQLELRQELAIADLNRRLAVVRLAQLRRLQVVGNVQEVEILRAELAVKEVEAEMQAIRRNLEAFER